MVQHPGSTRAQAGEVRLLRCRQAKQALLPFGEVVNLPTIQAQCPKGHVLNVTYHQGEKDITFRCPHCKADYRLKLPANS